jgi:NAD(P)-dependent dehydrogenase (short-subunit alcohol dehydrogenase family)
VRTPDLFDLSGRVAIVTGGGRGIGRQMATALAELGADVVVCSRKLDRCEEAAAQLAGLGVRALALACDAREPEQVEAVVRAAVERLGGLDVLVNNAGATWGAPLADYPADAWDKVMTLNTKSPFLLTRALVPQLEAAGTADDPARVINIGSIDGIQVPLMETYAYSSSKAAVHQLTRHLAKHLGPRNITVNAIAPGPFESKMMAATLRDFGDQIARSSPLGRIGRPDDMAGAAIYLASRAGAYVTGAVIPVDGGIATTK